MEKILIVAGFDKSLRLFRGDLIKCWLKLGYNVTAAAPGNDIKNWLEGLGTQFVNLSLDRTGLNPLKDIFLFFRLIKLVKAEKPGYLFLYTVKPVIYGSLAACLDKKCDVYSMITGLGFVFSNQSNKSNLLRKMVTVLYRIALKRNRKVFFQNPDDRDLFIGRGIVPENKVVLVNGSGVNLDYYKADAPEGDRVSFLMIGRLLEEKGVREYLEAAKIIIKRFPEVKFRLIGWFLDDKLSIKAEKIEEWKKEGIVELYGETDDVRPYISAASVYVLPSYREGTPRTVLEAMSMGRAVITTDVPGCRETVVEGINGFLVPAMDSKALAEAMQRFIDEPWLIEMMGKESRRIAEEKFDVHKVNQAINQAMGVI